MSVTFAVALRACCVAMALAWASVRAAEPTSPLIGATRDQILRRYGEPRSQIERGGQLVLFYPRERITLQNGVVVEVEQLSAEPVRRTPATPPSENPPPPANSTTPPATATPAPSDSTEARPPAKSPAPTTPPPATPSAPEPKVEIKLVLPPGAKDSRPASTPTSTPSTPALKNDSDAAKNSSAGQSGDAAPSQPQPALSTAPTPGSSASSTSRDESPKPAAQKEKIDPAKAKALEAAAAEKEKKAKAMKEARRRLNEAVITDPTEEAITGRTYLIGAIVIATGLGYLLWRYRQRQFELAATSVSNTPVTAPPVASASSGTVFTAEQLEKLPWKRFEALVAAYYSKTGVVASRTNTGPSSPVHIKISWKGEPRPFAYVQCIAHPSGLVEPKPLQDLADVLAAEDIRRGYVVTAGKFSVPARDLAEEKHLTLLPGDIFLEKLNALPASARAEIMQVANASE